jgi:hypothetical protein
MKIQLLNSFSDDNNREEPYCTLVRAMEPSTCLVHHCSSYNTPNTSFMQIFSISILDTTSSHTTRISCFLLFSRRMTPCRTSSFPALLESGLYGAARLQHRAVCGFHLSAKRDTADMMSKCYQHANYVKAAELLKFIEKCKMSVSHSASYPSFYPSFASSS